ncbi:beta strand repeat-containing protein, partial [Achromobacter xylosoxidans]|uniref:beta strand repeat-containing protein n=1 Tax=Alcaligenes xylosoxydans xylosoxydans TaxID=85698 RepID=UPI000ADB9162
TAEGNITNLGGRITTVEGSVTNLQTQITNGTAGLVRQDAASGNVTVAGATGGTSVNMAGTAGARTVTGVQAGGLSATSTDAVNGSQLFKTNADVTANTNAIAQNTANIANNTTAITNVDNRVSTVEGNITTLQTQVNNGTTGLVRQDAASGNVTVAGATGGTSVNMAGTAGARTVTGVQAGGLSATSTDAVNGSQLFKTNADVTANTNAIAQNTTDIANNTTAITNVDNRVSTVEGNVTTLQTQITNGTTGLVRQDATTANVTVAGTTGGTLVNMAGTAGARTVTGVQAGALAATSTDAVNGSQLF